MHHIFEKHLDLLKKWPSLGPIASHRLLNFFLTSKSTIQDFKKLLSFFEQYSTCSFCRAPLIQESCCNCLALDQCAHLLIVPHLMDYLLIEEYFFQKDCAFLLLDGYISPGDQRTAQSIGLSRAVEHIHIRKAPVYCLFNQSLEARGTQWVLKSALQNSIALKDCSDILGAKESLYVLSHKEMEAYKIQLCSKFSS
jgi:recombinational DNA repair protein RecR